MSSRTMFIAQEGPANALALNKDNTQVVIAGRNVFKVFSIDEEEFVECFNLRVGKNINLNFSCNDVAWNSIEDNILATAATNGAVVLWNLGRSSRSKQEHVFGDHKRTVNKVSFHSAEPNWLISGSQDGTMKWFDLRTKEATRTFYSNTESVRDVQFSPRQHHLFAGVSENGTVQLWDLRRPDRCKEQFTAHSGPIFACDWHPEISWLATASRDKTIKVWDLGSGKPSLEHTIHTIASVGRVKWRPGRRYHIASCALVVDCSISVWDVRRPYIPFAAFNEHKDVATGIAWKGDPHVFLSTSRDCVLYHHAFQDASRPSSKANPQGVCFNSRGDLSYACRVNFTSSFSHKISGILRKTPLHNEQFCQATSAMHQFVLRKKQSSQVHKTSAERFFQECTERYILSGRPLAEICDNNAAIAKEFGRHKVSLMWNIMKVLYTTCTHERGGATIPQITSGCADDSHSGNSAPVGDPASDGVALINAANERVGESVAPEGGSETVSVEGISIDAVGGEGVGGVGVTEGVVGAGEEAEAVTGDEVGIGGGQGLVPGPMRERASSLTSIASGLLCLSDPEGGGTVQPAQGSHPPLQEYGEFFFYVDQPSSGNEDQEEGQEEQQRAEGGAVAVVEKVGEEGSGDVGGGGDEKEEEGHEASELEDSKESEEDDDDPWDLPLEALPISLPHWDSDGDGANEENPLLTGFNQQKQYQGGKGEGVVGPPPAPLQIHPCADDVAIKPWNPGPSIRAAMELLASGGDVQTVSSILIALGNQRHDRVGPDGLPLPNFEENEAFHEHWLLAYLDFLARRKLWDATTQVIKMSWIPSVSQLSQQSTRCQTCCGRCGKALHRSGWLCDRCHSLTNWCSVCHEPVRGLYTWCQGCSHGGHLHHMEQWLSSHKYCPTGCGHACEYT
ncbi:GATOR2 complex protein WDR24 [Hetaerina americana]|uniref:GATOR2 complex protein WDR24 n=1 Tax=Hetaerina americana TaxID=62018 RepID=UPI003A7F38E4